MDSIIGVICAAGQGKRIKTISTKPKALVSIAGISLLHHTIYRMLTAGINQIFVIVRYNLYDFQTVIRQFNGRFGSSIKIIHLDESNFMDSPLNDIVTCINRKFLPQFKSIIVSYCDIVTDFLLYNLIELHLSKDSLATVLLFLGDINIYMHKYCLESDGKISSISEKKGGTIYANGGIFLLNKKLIEGLDENKKIEFSSNGGPIEKAYNLNSLFGISSEKYYFKEVGNVRNLVDCEADILSSEYLYCKLFGNAED